MHTFTQVFEEMEIGVAPTPKSSTSLESGYLVHVNAIKGFPKHEARHGV
jgi:hypothetical protein